MYFPHQDLGTIKEQSTGTVWRPEDIDAAAARCHGLLRQRGIGPGDVVFIYHGGSGAFFGDLFGVWRAGACAACLNPGITRSELETMVGFIGPKLILSGEVGAKGEVSGVAIACSVDAGNGDTDVEPQSDHAAGLDDQALILFTSGTTGTPKGVVHTFRSLVARVHLNRLFIGDDRLQNTLCVLPTHFGHGLIGNCLTPLLFGHNLVLMPGSDMTSVGKLGKVVDENNISFMSSVPTFWKLATKLAAKPEFGTLKRVSVGSAPLSADVWNSIITWAGTDEVVNMYGITETANWLAGASASEFEPEDGLIGRMWGGMAAVKTESGEILSIGEGELLVQSPSLMSSYYKLQDLTEQVLIDGWFHTGDIGRIDEDGMMRLTGRQKNEINRAGMKIQPEDIDLLLERHDAVREACAFGYPDNLSGEGVGVALCFVDDAEADIAAVRSWCSERLVREKRPDKWFVVDEIPKTDRGKMNRQNVADFCMNEN